MWVYLIEMMENAQIHAYACVNRITDWANCPDTRQSVGGFLFTLGLGPVSWQSKRQRTVATSSCEAEYTAAFEALKEAIWLRTLFSSIGLPPMSATTLL